MRRINRLLFVMGVCFVLSGCSVNENVADLYKKEKPITAEIIVPERFISNQEDIIKVVLTQDGEPLEKADFVHFEIWKQDESIHYNMEDATAEGNGVYSMWKPFDKEGLYFLKIHASSKGSLITPQAQFVVGELSESELDFLQKGVQPKVESHEHHH